MRSKNKVDIELMFTVKGKIITECEQKKHLKKIGRNIYATFYFKEIETKSTINVKDNKTNEQDYRTCKFSVFFFSKFKKVLTSSKKKTNYQNNSYNNNNNNKIRRILKYKQRNDDEKF